MSSVLSFNRKFNVFDEFYCCAGTFFQFQPRQSNILAVLELSKLVNSSQTLIIMKKKSQLKERIIFF